MRTTLLPILAIALVAAPSAGQPAFLRGALEEAEGAGRNRNDLEGGIWEYKVIDRAGERKTALVGKLRIKDSAGFDVAGSAEGSLLDSQQEAAGEGKGSFPFGIKPPTPQRLGVLDRVAESNRGGDRIADITYERSHNSTDATPKVTFQFDADDKHPLSGQAMVKYDTRHGGGVWRGDYYEALPDGKKKRWKFELRGIED